MKIITAAWRSALGATILMTAHLAPAWSQTPPPQQSSPAFLQGQIDRQAWETWFTGINGDYHAGALYWSGQRSLAHPGSCATPPTGSGADWTAGCLAAQAKLAAPDIRRKAEPDYRLGWNNPAPSGTTPAATSMSPPATPTTARLPATSPPERAPIGHHANESAVIISKAGVGTANASMQILMDWDREVWACTNDYLTPPDGEPNQKGYAECLSYARANFKGPSTPTARANCLTGELTGFWTNIPRTYAGRIKEEYQDDTTHKTKEYYVDVFNYEGFRIPNAGYTGVWEDAEIFRELCPTSFLGAPTTTLPELDLSIDCQQALDSATKLVMESGIGHVLNYKIIDAWDIQGFGTTWYSSKCSAKITLNNGNNGLLEYEYFPRHGKYFLKARIIP
jgi:hypothetical protein